MQLHDVNLQSDRLKSQLEQLSTENEKLRNISRENIRGSSNVRLRRINQFSELLQIKKEYKVRERNLIEEKTAYFEEKKLLASKITELDQQYRRVEKVQLYLLIHYLML